MHVRPLYLHMFPPAYAPNLCFIGLPWRCAKVPQFQLQGQLLARVLSGRAQLPSLQEMQQVHVQARSLVKAAHHCLCFLQQYVIAGTAHFELIVLPLSMKRQGLGKPSGHRA